MQVLNPNNLPMAPINELQATQGDLKFLSKTNYDKLKKNIEKHGFDIPVTVWIDSQGEKWLLDGHQRKHVLETEGWLNPIPYLVIKAPNMKTAAERLLEITSQYGTITQEGLDEYIAKFELPEIETLEMTNFDSIFDFSSAKAPEDDLSFGNDEPVKETDKKVIEIQCPECGYHAPSGGFTQYNDDKES